MTAAPTAFSVAAYDVERVADVVFAVHDGVELIGDLWRPRGVAAAPALVAAHGGAWHSGERARYAEWGAHFAARGLALFSIDYRLSRPHAPSFPAAVCDVRAAVQFVRANASALGLDPARLGMIGDSAGAHLCALSALAWREPLFAQPTADDPQAATSAAVKAVVGLYGIYDLVAQWEHDQATRSGDLMTVKFLGCAPPQNRRVYFDASPLSYATLDRNETRFLLVDGAEDDIVDRTRQAQPFVTALKHANAFARAIVAPHVGLFWVVEPFEEPGSPCAAVAPRILRFLAGAL